jgi:leucyl-tRNA synthetase
MFTSPPDQSLEWNDEGVEGAHRFIKRLWNLAEAGQGAYSIPNGLDLDEAQKTARREIHEALKKALFDYDRQQFNTVVSACMSMVNTLYKLGESEADRAVLREGLSLVLRLLGPIAPHVTHSLWRDLGYGEEILDAEWPRPDEEALRQESIQYVVQVNGKMRAKIQVPAGADTATAEALARENENVQRFIADTQVRKVIVVPGKLVNIVVG